MLHISTTAFEQDILTPEGLSAAKGYAALELSGGRHRDPDDLLNALDALKAQGAASILVHNYFPPPAEPFVLNFATADADLLDRSLDLARNAIGLCAALGAPYYSFHPGYLRDGRERPDGHFEFDGPPRPMADALARFHVNFPALAALARQAKVRLAMENLFPTRSEVTSLANTLDEMEALLAPLPEEAGLLLDLGHLAVSATILGFDRRDYLETILARHGNRLFEVHLSGNDGETDAHLPITPGDWQLDVLPRLRGLPGVDGLGVRVTLESRRLSPESLRETSQLITNHCPPTP